MKPWANHNISATILWVKVQTCHLWLYKSVRSNLKTKGDQILIGDGTHMTYAKNNNLM